MKQYLFHDKLVLFRISSLHLTLRGYPRLDVAGSVCRDLGVYRIIVMQPDLVTAALPTVGCLLRAVRGY